MREETKRKYYTHEYKGQVGLEALCGCEDDKQDWAGISCSPYTG